MPIKEPKMEVIKNVEFDPVLLKKYTDAGWSDPFSHVTQNLRCYLKTWCPEECVHNLKHFNPHNRTQSDSYILRLAKEIIQKRFLPTSTIHRDIRKNLLDGQGRMAGCAASGLPMTTWVVDGWPSTIQVEGVWMPTWQFFDLGRVRSNSDVQGVLNRSDPDHAKPGSPMSAGARTLVNWISDYRIWGTCSPPQYILVMGKIANELVWAYEYAKKAKKDGLIGVMPQGSLYGLLAYYRLCFKERSEQFAKRMFRGIGCVEDDPAQTLKLWCSLNRGNRGQGPKATLIHALAIYRFHKVEPLPVEEVTFKMALNDRGKLTLTRGGAKRQEAALRAGVEASKWLWERNPEFVAYIKEMVSVDESRLHPYPIVKAGTTLPLD